MSAQRDTLRIVQVETFYSPYLNNAYNANPSLKTKSWREQTDALLHGGFSALHNIAPYLEPLGYESHFIVANNGPSQMAWLQEHGHPLPKGGVAMHDILRQQIEHLAPDILYFSDCSNFDSRFVRTLSHRPRLVIGWQAAPVPAGTDWSAFDVLLSGLSAMRTAALRLGARATEHFMPGFPSWIAAAIGPVQERHDLLFAGSYTSQQHARRNRLLTRLAEEASSGTFDCAFHLTSPPQSLPPALAPWAKPPAFGLEMHRLLRTGRIVFDSRSDMTAVMPNGEVIDVAGSETANMRLFETTGSGGFLLTEHHENLSDYFEIGREIESFRSEGELLEKLRHYLARPDERHAIARRGQERCLNDHAMGNRIHDFDSIIHRHLSSGTARVTRQGARHQTRDKESKMPATETTTGSAHGSGHPPIRHFCTYFDGNYASRGLVMIDSIRRFLPNAHFHVLCLDDAAHRIVTEKVPTASAIRLAELESFDPELAACRTDRTKVEYYFTCTPCLPRLVLARHPEAQHVTYLDSDLYFYRSPEEVFAAIGDGSVAITPHRFSPACADREIYGRFNVAWVSWRNDEEGRRCLNDYRADCLAWCHDRLENDRFADQKYLDRWPERYANLRILNGKGINLALWNVDSHRLHRRDDGAFLVDDELLVFVHFHGIKHMGPGTYDLRLRDYHVRGNMPFLVDEIYKPYLSLIDDTFKGLATDYGLAIPGDPRFGQARHQKMEGGAGSQTASPPRPTSLSTGYTVVERRTALELSTGGWADDAWGHSDVGEWQETAYRELLEEMRKGRTRIDMAVGAAAVAACGLETPTLLEVGCASGYYHEVFNHFLGGRVRYTGVDRSDTMIRLARQWRPGVSFEVADATRLPLANASIDIVFNGVALMHIMDYEAAIAESRRVARRFVIFHTVPLLRHRPTTYLSKLAYGRPTVEVILNEGELRVLFARHGLAVRRVWNSIPYDLSAALGEKTETRSFLCEVVESVHATRPSMLTIGDGGPFHDEWVNLDVSAQSETALPYAPIHPLPFADSTFDAVRHAHMLDRIPRTAVPALLTETLRVLKPGGLLRLATPDLEQRCRLYLKQLEQVEAGDQDAEDALDRTTRKLLAPMLGEDDDGRVCEWMYDHVLLRRLLTQAGFTQIGATTASESSMPDYAAYGLDAEADGRARRPDTLFIEARKPD